MGCWTSPQRLRCQILRSKASALGAAFSARAGNPFTGLEGLAPIWPARLAPEGENLNDVWHHLLATPEGLVSFHKLFHWRRSSLPEVMEEAGIAGPGAG